MVELKAAWLPISRFHSRIIQSDALSLRKAYPRSSAWICLLCINTATVRREFPTTNRSEENQRHFFNKALLGGDLFPAEKARFTSLFDHCTGD